MNIEETVSKMSLREKIQLISGKSVSNTRDMEEYGIRSLYMTDGSNGVRLWDNTVVTCYPSVSAQAATWNRQLSFRMGEILASECMEKDVAVLLAPGMNIKRNPLCGRNFEYYSEDVYLTWNMASAFIDGVQSYNIGACAKHFACNNQELGARTGISSNVSERALREVYARTFEKVIGHSRPRTLMSAYNKLNGTYCSQNKFLLHDLLKGEFGYEGLVMSDWGAVHDKAESVKAGLDLEMPTMIEGGEASVEEALSRGELSMEEIDEKVRHVLQLIEDLSKKTEKPKVSPQERKAVSSQIAQESICLLKNDGILPLAGEGKKILVVGELAAKPAIQGGGCAHVNCFEPEQPLAQIEKYAGKNEVMYAQGYIAASLEYNGVLAAEAVEKAKEADLVICMIGDPDNIEREVFDRAALTFPNSMWQLCDDLLRTNENVIFVIQAGSVVDLRLIESRAKAILFQWYAGQYGAEAIAKALFGEINPSGRLTESFVRCCSDSPSAQSYMANDLYVDYNEGILVGYKYFDYYGLPLQYPFGYGLSYTEFCYGDLELKEEEDAVRVGVTIRNAGTRAGSEVVQVYVSHPGANVLKPKKWLAAFDKVYLAEGESRRVELKVSKSDLEYYNETKGAWWFDNGEYVFSLNKNVQETYLSGRIELTGKMRR